MVLPAVQTIRGYDDGSDMAGIPHRALLVVLALLLLPAVASAKQARPYAPSEQQSFDAVLTDWTAITKTPGGKSVFEMQPETFYRAKQHRLLVLEGRDVDGRALAQGAAAGVVLARHDGGLAQGQGRRAQGQPLARRDLALAGTLKIVHRGRVVRTAHVGTGTNSTPTPAGLHATYDHWRSDHAVLGDWTVSLTTHSPQVPVFDGKQAVVAIHGWAAGGGGTGAVSHGCVRVTDDSLMRMVALKLPIGTPVQVT